MRRNLLLGFSVLLVLALSSASVCFATTVKGRSGYGPGPISNPGLTFSSCADPLGTEPCEIFDLVDQVGTASFNGTTTFGIYQFAFNPSGAGGQTLDVINLGALSSGTTFTLTGSLFDPANLEVFACADSPSTTGFFLQDSLQAPVPGPCTPNVPSGPLSTSSLIYNPGTGKFTLNQSLSDLVLDFAPGSAPTGTPEPASFALLGLGLATIGAKLRRKAA